MYSIAYKRAQRLDDGRIVSCYDGRTEYRVGHATRVENWTGKHDGLFACSSLRAAWEHEVPSDSAHQGNVVIRVLIPRHVTKGAKLEAPSMLVLEVFDSLECYDAGGYISRFCPALIPAVGASGWYTRGGTPISHPSAYRPYGWSNIVHHAPRYRAFHIAHKPTATLDAIASIKLGIQYALRGSKLGRKVWA